MSTSWRSRFWAYISAPGVFWWGLPVAITTAVWLQARTYGLRWEAFWNVEFLVMFAVMVFFGVIGGNVFGRMMRRHGVDLGVLDGKDPESRSNDR